MFTAYTGENPHYSIDCLCTLPNKAYMNHINATLYERLQLPVQGQCISRVLCNATF